MKKVYLLLLCLFSSSLVVAFSTNVNPVKNPTRHTDKESVFKNTDVIPIINKNVSSTQPQWFEITAVSAALVSDGLTLCGSLAVLISRKVMKLDDPFTGLVSGIAVGDLLVAINGIVEYLLAVMIPTQYNQEFSAYVWVTISQFFGISGATMSNLYSVFLAIHGVTETKSERLWK